MKPSSDKKHSFASLINLEDITKWSENKEKANQEDNKDFVPSWSVLRAKVNYVDAKLVRQFADALEDANIMSSFAASFFGAMISFLIAFVTSQTSSQSILFGTSTVFCILLTFIFLALTVRNKIKVKKTKKRIEVL